MTKMKSKQIPMNLLFIFFLSIFVKISLIYSYECYKQGMIKVPFDTNNLKYSTNYQSNKLYLKKSWKNLINGYSYAQYTNSIDFKRNVHIYLRDSLDYYWEFCNTLYGTTIILGKHQYYMPSYNEGLLINGLTSSIVIAFQNNKNRIAIFDCSKSSCNVNSPSSTYTYQFPSTLLTNFHIIYDYGKKNLLVYKDSPTVRNNLMISYKVDIPSFLDGGIGYMGITATYYICALLHDISQSFICSDGGEKISPTVSLNYKNETVAPGGAISVPAYSQAILIVKYKSKAEKDLMGEGKFSVDEKEYDLLSQDDSSFTFSFYSGTKAGDQNKVVYNTTYESFEFTVNIISGEPNQIVYLYQKRSDEGDCFYFDENNNRVLQHGSLSGTKSTCGGDFDLSDFAEDDQQLIFYVQTLDKYGNKASDSMNQRSIFDDFISKETTGISILDVEYSLFQIVIGVNHKGTYRISSSYLDHSIVFYVKDYVPSSSSFCKLEERQFNFYLSEQIVTYNCYYKDIKGDDNIISESRAALPLFLKAKVIRIPTDTEKEESFDVTPSEKCEQSSCSYTFTTSYNGKFKFIASYEMKDIKEDINSSFDIFYVVPIPTSFSGSKFFNYETNLWIKDIDLNENVFIYNELRSNDDRLFGIELVDIKDPNKTPYSEIQYGYETFTPNELITGEISEEHSGYSDELEFDYDTIDNKKYLVCLLKNSKEKIRRTSFPYKIVLKINDSEILLTYKILLNKVGQYTACRKELAPSKSKFEILISPSETLAGNYVPIGNLILQTDCEDHLYNYFLKDESNISFIAYDKNENECSDCNVKLSQSSNIYGIYNMQFMSEKASEYTIYGKINNIDLLEGYNTYQVIVSPLSQAYYLYKTEKDEEGKEDESKYSVEEPVKFGFIVKDQYENVINYELISSDMDNSLGLSYSLRIGDEEYTSIIKNSGYVKFFNDEKGNYYIQDQYTKSGNYTLVISTKYSTNKIVFNYYKGPGAASALYSQIKVINANQLNLNVQSSVQVILYDCYQNFIGADSQALEREIKKVEIVAKSQKEIVLNYPSGSVVENTYYVFKSDYTKYPGSYYVTGTINGEIISSCSSCLFDVVDLGFSFMASQLKIIGDKISVMTENGYYILYENMQRPAFEFDFLTNEGIESGSVDADSCGVSASIVNSSTKKSEILEAKWISGNKLFWSIPDEFTLENGNDYYIKISSDKETTDKIYYLKIVNYGEDGSLLDDYDISKTLISPYILYLQVGISDSILIEFKDRNGLRYNNDLNLDLLSIEIPDNLKDSISVLKKKGVKNGQFILEINSIKSCSYSDNIKLTIIYNDEVIQNKVIIITSSGNLDHFEIDTSCLIDQEKNILNSGTVDSLPKISLLPYDKYNNLIRDSIFNSKTYPEDAFGYLFKVEHSENQKVSVISSINQLSNLVVLNLNTEYQGELTLSSIYLKNKYKMEVKSGNAGKKTVGYLKDTKLNTVAGSERVFVIEPKDNYGNVLANPSVDDFAVKVFDLNDNLIEIIDKKEITAENLIECKINNNVSGTKIIKAFYGNDKEIILYNNVINTINSDIDLEQTKLSYNDREYLFSEENVIQISVSSLPIMDIQLYDKNNNKITDHSKYKIDFNLLVNENQLIKYQYYRSFIRLYIDEQQVNNYFSIDSENQYELKLSMDSVVKKIKIQFSGLPPKSNMEPPSSFTLNTQNLEIVAGEKGIFNLNFYTAAGNLVGYFFENLSSEININCGNDYPIETEIDYNKNYGKYNIVINSNIKTENSITCTVSAINMSHQFNLVVKANKALSCSIVDNDNKELNELNDAVADNKYEIRVLCYDEYKNIAKIDSKEFSYFVYNEKLSSVNAETKINNDDSLNIIIYPTVATKYHLVSAYITEEKTFNSLAGEISEENSYLEIGESAKAGDEVYLYINCLDKYNNRIDFNVDEEKYLSYFDLYHRYQLESGFSDYQKIAEAPSLVIENEKSYIKYKTSVSAKNINEFRAIYQKTSIVIKCANCELKVESGELSLEKSDIYKYDSFSSSFKKIEEVDEILYNYNEKLLIKISPKDVFGNSLDARAYSKDLSVIFNNNNLDIDENSSSSGEFLLYSGDFSNLEYGSYDFSLIYLEKTKKIEIYVAGAPNTEIFIDKNLDLNKTKILDSKLEFSVGEYGYFNFELRNLNNIRLQDITSLDIKIILNKDQIEATIINSHSSTILILFTSNKANTFPTKTPNELQVIIGESQQILNLNIYVSPGELNSAEINSIYIQSDHELIPVSTDDKLKFSVIGYDLSSNRCPIKENIIKLILKSSSNEEVLYLKTSTDIITGEQNYIYELTKIGIYSIIAGKNNVDENLFDENYKISIVPGNIDPEKTVIQINDDFIKAGQETSVSIYPKDKYNNNVQITEQTSNNFKVYLLGDNQEKISVDTIEYDSSTINFKTQLVTKGDYYWNFQLKGDKITCYKCITTVKPSTCAPENTLISTRDKLGSYHLYSDINHAYSSIDFPLSVHLTFRDAYNNIIESIKDEIDNIKITEAYLFGNNMENKLYWSSSINNDYSQIYLDLDLNKDQNKHILEHLVSRKDDKSYLFSFTVNNEENKKEFTIKVDHDGKSESEDDYGNGNYCLEKSVLSEKIVKSKVGESYEITLELRTKEGLLYNDDIDINTQIKCDQLRPDTFVDKTFTCQISKKNNKINGVYSIVYYSEMQKFDSEKIFNEIKLYNPETQNLELFESVQLISTIGVPCQEKTKIITKLPSKLSDNTDKPVIEYILSDKYDNVYQFPDDISDNLRFVNHDVSIIHQTILSPDGKTYISTLEPNYPPKDVSIQLLYVDSDNVYIPLFPQTQNSTFEYDVDYMKSKIISNNKEKMSAGDLLDLQIILLDVKDQCYIDDNFDVSLLSVTVQGPFESFSSNRKYSFVRVIDEGSLCKYSYKINIDDSNKYTKSGTYSIIVYADKTNKAFTQKVSAGPIDINNFEVSFEDESLIPMEIPAGNMFYFYIKAFDSYENQIDYEPLSDFQISLVDISKKEIPSDDFIQRCSNSGDGILRCSFKTNKSGTYVFNYKYQNKDVVPKYKTGPNYVNYIPGKCNEKFPNIIYPESEDADISNPYIYNVICSDQFNNTVSKGGDVLTSSVSLFIFENNVTIDIDSEVKDNGDGTYSISFIPPLIGEYSIYTYLDGNKYGEEEVFNLTGSSCAENQYKCPNNNKCVNDLRQCIPEDQRCQDSAQSEQKPFKCKVNGQEICVKSRTECDPENENYYKCDYMNTIVTSKENEFMCFYPVPTNCKGRYPRYPYYCDDGICRKSFDLTPNQRVCPIGKVLCPDLTCADRLEDCHVYGICDSVKCIDQSCAKSQALCPLTITCANKNDVVCPDGTCVENEIYCAALKSCPPETPYLCFDNSCAVDAESCTRSISCGHGYALCSDLICREEC